MTHTRLAAFGGPGFPVAWSSMFAESRRSDPFLLINPADDLAFAEDTRSAVGAGATTTESLEAALRASYPDIVVRQRDLAGELFTIWYVYRDGHWTRTQRRNTDR